MHPGDKAAGANEWGLSSRSKSVTLLNFYGPFKWIFRTRVWWFEFQDSKHQCCCICNPHLFCLKTCKLKLTLKMVKDSIFFILKIAGERVSRIVDNLLVLLDAVEKTAEKRFVEVFLAKCLESDCNRGIQGKPHVIHSPKPPYTATAKVE